MDQMTIYLILAGVFGLFMAWGIGANDVANAMATSVGSGALRIKQAVILAAIFEFSGAYLAGGEVTKTIRKGIVEADAFHADPNLLIWGRDPQMEKVVEEVLKRLKDHPAMHTPPPPMEDRTAEGLKGK